MAGNIDAVEIVQGADRIELTVKVVPGASRTKVAGEWGGALRLAVAAPPEGGKANAAVIELLATVLGVKKGQVVILGGQAQPLKRIAVRRLGADEARACLARVL